VALPIVLASGGRNAMCHRAATGSLDADQTPIPGAGGSQTAAERTVSAYAQALAKPRIEPIAHKLLVNREVPRFLSWPPYRRRKHPGSRAPRPKASSRPDKLAARRIDGLTDGGSFSQPRSSGTWRTVPPRTRASGTTATARGVAARPPPGQLRGARREPRMCLIARTFLIKPGFGSRRLEVGPRITVEIIRPDWVDKDYRFTVRFQRGSRIEIRCLAPGGTVPGQRRRCARP